MKWLAGLGAAGLLTAAVSGQGIENTARSLSALVAEARGQITTSPAVALRSAGVIRAQAMAHGGRDRLFWLAAGDGISAAALVGLNRPKDALAVNDRGLRAIVEAAPKSAVRGELLLARANAYSMLGHTEQAIAHYHLAHRIFVSAGDQHGQAVALANIAVSYSDARDYETAARYNREAIQVLGKDPILLMSIYNNDGVVLLNLGRLREAERELILALKAAVTLKQPLIEARILENLTRSQVDAGRFAQADQSLAHAFALASSGPAASWRPALYGVAARLAFRRHDLDHAASLIDRAFGGNVKSEAAMDMRDYHQIAYEIFRARGDDAKALSHLESFKRLDDKARALAASTNAALMSAKFDFANQDLRIAKLRAGRAEQDATLARTRVRYHTIITAGLLAAAAIVSTLLAIGFVSITRSRNQVRAANATLKTTNADLERALAAKGEFLATTSHEIRTPLNGILGMTQVMLADRALAAPLRTRVELIHGAGETMRALVDDILDMAKMETGELRIHPAEMNLHRLLADARTVWDGQAETKGIALDMDLARAPAAIVADEVRLRQIVFNLMANAIKFTDRGHVRLTAAAEPCGESGGGEGSDGGETLVIRIADSGIGIPSDRLADIFESFRQVDGGTTRRHGGTGLGLAICRNLARAMGGDVTVESTLGAGSTFIVSLPLVRAEVPVAEEAVAARAVASLADAQLLLIEPNPLSQGILRALVGPQARGLTIAADPPAGRAVLDGGGVDHLLADAGAFGLDAEAAAAFARAAAPARVTILWPTPDAAVQEELADAGAQVLAKPIAAPDLLAALRMGYHDAVAQRDMAA